MLSSGTPCGWMNSGTPSSSALAQTGSNFGSENSTPSTTPPIAAPFSPCFFTAVSSCCTARSGACRVSEAKAAKRSGFEAQSSASFSFWIFTICPARSRSWSYQNGLIDSTSMSTACAVHRGEPLVDLDEGFLGAVDRRNLHLRRIGAEQGAGFAEMAVRVHVDGLDPLAADHHRQCLACRLLGVARCGRPQLQKTMPAAAATPAFRKSRRVVMTRSSLAFVFFGAG